MVTFSVDMSVVGVTDDIEFRISLVNGEYNPSEWFLMEDPDGDMIYTYTMPLTVGFEYGYNFYDGWYEDGANIEGVCAAGLYGNDRTVVVEETDMVLDTVCWESCEACPEIVLGCTDSTAYNYDYTATENDGTCIYELIPDNLFFSEYAEGSSNNKYLEIYNGGTETVDLSMYGFASVSNAPTTVGEYEYWNSFDEGATIAAGDVYIIAHPVSYTHLTLPTTPYV